MRDYYSVAERIKYYRWRSKHPKYTESQKRYAKHRLEQLRKIQTTVYKPKYVERHKVRYKTIGQYLEILKRQKHHWDCCKESHPKLVHRTQTLKQAEIERIEKFRHKKKLSLKDPLLILRNKEVRHTG